MEVGLIQLLAFIVRRCVFVPRKPSSIAKLFADVTFAVIHLHFRLVGADSSHGAGALFKVYSHTPAFWQVSADVVDSFFDGHGSKRLTRKMQTTADSVCCVDLRHRRRCLIFVVHAATPSTIPRTICSGLAACSQGASGFWPVWPVNTFVVFCTISCCSPLMCSMRL